MKTSFLFVAVVLVGCGRPESQPALSTVPVTETPTDFAVVRKVLFSETDNIVLRSHNGVWEGRDDDLELVLRVDGTALITDFGYMVTKQSATYELSNEGMLTIKPDAARSWLPMKTTMGGGKLVVSRPNLSDARRAAVDAGFGPEEVTEEVIAEAFDQWPLRQVTPK